ncbi:molybdopterin-guanine dinucleotide biosynthesis protein B [Paramagnetospirillum kuznetsovii]|uniref:Molybdopterin-guanine dinucleotide biosynthesis protein B n=1 Tax=Paramagnetospirillum kuznetsovii TaxID=2053833 RepID=A0A364NW95_9PROT|nr:molybdopterin-guanine dinucleotide biosynthesis protein B [Paramagnetospirillum kuznetsovii]RAU21359.1 molybdopterin-guanine dinucleotide biosynthesis protein B [Paramagnetospirillum kuznetsovii]
MKIFGIAGWSGSGKTTLLVRLIPALNRLGIEVATVKHTHHNPAVGDDDCRALAAAGAVETLVASRRRFALINEFHGRAEPPLDELVTRFKGIDLLLIEGFKWAPHPKLEVWDAGLGKPLLAATEASIVAVVSDLPVAEVPLPRFLRDDVEGVAQFIIRKCGF